MANQHRCASHNRTVYGSGFMTIKDAKAYLSAHIQEMSEYSDINITDSGLLLHSYDTHPADFNFRLRLTFGGRSSNNRRTSFAQRTTVSVN